MVDFEAARLVALAFLSRTENIRVLEASERKKVNLGRYAHVWQIDTEIFFSDDTTSTVALFMALPEDFPLVLPKIYISRENRLSIGFIPHVDVAGNICFYDEETITINPNEPGRLAKSCLDAGRDVLERGIQGKNNEDFVEEFVSYWSDQYSEKDSVCAGLSMFSTIPEHSPCLIKYWDLRKNFGIYRSVLVEEGILQTRFQSYLKRIGYSIIEREALYLGTAKDLKPPFNYTNGTVLQFIKDNFPDAFKDFERYVNRVKEQRLILFSVNSQSETLLFGWFIDQLNLHRKGYRPGALSPMSVLNTFQRHNNVLRVRFDNYTKERLEKRTDGFRKELGYSVIIAGLGSIGSNLLPFLLPVGIDNMLLIDSDFLSLENINRHLLGPEYIGQAKVEGIKHHLETSDPLIEIRTHKTSLIQLLQKDLEAFNHSNYLFVVIGKSTVENYVLDLLRDQTLKVPTFIIWIEPYLLGGHCLYINPGHAIDLKDLYEDYLYKYNIIDSLEYTDLNKQLQLSEAGCQGSYTPYGQRNITLFLSSLTPYIYDLIENKDTRNLILTWRGRGPDSITLKLTQYGNALRPGEIKTIEVDANKS